MTDPKELAKLFPKRERRPTTNYDRLVSKTPEEMAAFLADHPVVSTFSPDNPHHKEWLDWLKQPAAEE